MSMILASLQLNNFKFENNINQTDFIDFVGHKENETVYGGLFKTEKGLLLQLTKHVEINANKPSPKIASEEISKFKFVDDKIWDSFKVITHTEYCGRWGLDFSQVKIKGIDY